MPTFKIILEYDGQGFSGWQRQPSRRTVQGAVEEALSTILGEPVEVQGASRTDAGVHARGQVASFSFDGEADPTRIARGVSALCRPNVSVVGAAVAPDGFNARFDSRGKRYEYRILNRSAPSPLDGDTSWHVPQALDLEAMRDAAGALVGTHDFAGFRAADDGREDTVRTLTSVSVDSAPGGLLTIGVEGTGFLKYMVRIIAGTLAEIGLGKLPRKTPSIVFGSGDRGAAGQTAPANGLTLIEVFY